MIHVCYGLFDKDGRYSKWTATSMLSMFENTSCSSITVHILHDNTLTPENRDKFTFIARRYNQSIKFYNMEKLCPEKIKFLRERFSTYLDSRFSIGAFYRLFISKNFFLPENISKLIYLDSDTIINLDIAELWDYPLENYPIAAVPETQATRNYNIKNKFLLNSGQVKAEDYFCSGVVVLNLEKTSENFFYDTMNWLFQNLNCECPDQDALNYFFSTNYCRLPEKFDSFVRVAKNIDNNEIFNKIYHYAGNNALSFDMKNSLDKLFFSYFAKTPFFNEDTLAHMFETAKKVYAQQKNFALIVSAISANKGRVFFLPSNTVDTVKQIFRVKDTEKIIVIDDGTDSFQTLVQSMQETRDKNLFFIFAANFLDIKRVLEKAGFAEGTEFIDATLFLHDEHGFPLTAWQFLRAL